MKKSIKRSDTCRRKQSSNGNPLQDERRLFTEANAAWDRGELRQAFTLFSQAAELGDVASQLDLGFFFDQGISVKKNKKQALAWYRKAYLQGDAGAANNIATIYRDFGDTRKMMWWYRRAAAMGDIDVLLDLGKRYETGLEVPVNVAKAKLYYGRVLRSKNATEDDTVEARARLAGLSERAGVPHKP